MPVTIEAFQGDAPRGGVFGALINGYGASKAQYRLTFDTRGGPVQCPPVHTHLSQLGRRTTRDVLVPGDGSQVQASPYIAKPRPVTRAGWGCDESLRFNNGQEIWARSSAGGGRSCRTTRPPRTTTGTPPAQVRSIYYYHAVTQGWGDIGYHALVGNNKATYEGRKSSGRRDAVVRPHGRACAPVQCGLVWFRFHRRLLLVLHPERNVARRAKAGSVGLRGAGHRSTREYLVPALGSLLLQRAGDCRASSHATTGQVSDRLPGRRRVRAVPVVPSIRAEQAR